MQFVIGWHAEIRVLISMISLPGEPEKFLVAFDLARIRSVREVAGVMASNGVVRPDTVRLGDQTMCLTSMPKPHMGRGKAEGIVGSHRGRLFGFAARARCVQAIASSSLPSINI